jgi:hypothetical protein
MWSLEETDYYIQILIYYILNLLIKSKVGLGQFDFIKLTSTVNWPKKTLAINTQNPLC